ncbi:MAG TPA: cobyric acid synthase [Nitrospirales bacterium]|nr:cobyric acid synthase [Nitrospiraceae bacterium]HNP27434.1 cobyric acid synthase [Nitrospirales bacterium]
MNRALAILGTGSDVGKSLVTAGLCRLLHRAGVRVAPFKAQNMSLNSFVTADGGEMGRAQVLQAQACGLAPHVDMNPILLKPEADAQSQVIVQGRVWRSQNARDYFERKSDLFEFVKASYERLSKQYEVMVIEGAGSAAEMNLRNRDIVNWPMVEMADASVVLVADIDRGGVFAQVIGTMDLLEPEERRRVIGVVINKFRGDLTLFEDGVTIIETRTGVPVFGVLPYLRDLDLDQEDSVAVERFRMTPFKRQTVNVAVVLLPHMSNFTDFNQLAAEPDVALRYVASPQEIYGADAIVLPGSKTTINDLGYLRKAGFHEALMTHVQRGGELMGICGGFQMLGNEINDPSHVETGGSSKGFGLLEVSTELLAHKKTVQVCARALLGSWGHDCLVEGYEIHMGVTKSSQDIPSCFGILPNQKKPSLENEDVRLDGAMSLDGRVWGTYIHGVFDQPDFRRQWLNRVRVRKGLAPLDTAISKAVSQRLLHAMDRWADHLEAHLNVNAIFSALNLGGLSPEGLHKPK